MAGHLRSNALSEQLAGRRPVTCESKGHLTKLTARIVHTSSAPVTTSTVLEKFHS